MRCADGYRLQKHACVIDNTPRLNGVRCATHTECAQQWCRGGRCCASNAKSCVACDRDGDCTKCADGYLLDQEGLICKTSLKEESQHAAVVTDEDGAHIADEL